MTQIKHVVWASEAGFKKKNLPDVVVQFAARRRGNGTEESSEARVWWRNTKLLLRGGLHLREHRERAVLLHLAGQCDSSYSQVTTLGNVFLTLLPPLGGCRRGRASLNTGWTIYVPNKGRCFIISASWKASQSVSDQS